MDSVDYPPPSPFKCPRIRTYDYTSRHPFQKKEIDGGTYSIIDNSYQIFDDEGDMLSLSHQLRLLYGCNNKEGESNGLYCLACHHDKIGTTYYFCNQCESSYHKECVESPPKLLSPYHPKYPLQLLNLNHGCVPECHSCGLTFPNLSYYSSIRGIFMDPVCAIKWEFPAIHNPKRHEHALHYFPRKASLTCDVCGLDDNRHRFYICYQCGFVVHITCIYLPCIILIYSHNHRLSFTSSLPSGNWICGLCRQKIDENYGEYSCTKGCTYAVHSKCATQRSVWDGEELEYQPEIDDLKSFEEIGDGTIRHFTHEHHHMRLSTEDIERVYDGEQHCQACMLPHYYENNVYRCMQCDFTLHKACATLPRRKQNMVHPHWFTLKPSNTESYFCCESCGHFSCGFRYVCCEGCDYNLDVKCASLPQQLNHRSHPHPLYFLINERESYRSCWTCGNAMRKSLNCVECQFALCFSCATLPYKVKHEDDEHMLTLSYERTASRHPYWCQVCEEITDPKEGYYTCDECGVTFHIGCTLGADNPYLKAGQTIDYKYKKIEIIANNRLCRPICTAYVCHKRCQHKIAYKTPAGNIFCSLGEINFWDR